MGGVDRPVRARGVAVVAVGRHAERVVAPFAAAAPHLRVDAVGGQRAAAVAGDALGPAGGHRDVVRQRGVGLGVEVRREPALPRDPVERREAAVADHVLGGLVLERDPEDVVVAGGGALPRAARRARRAGRVDMGRLRAGVGEDEGGHGEGRAAGEGRPAASQGAKQCSGHDLAADRSRGFRRRTSCERRGRPPMPRTPGGRVAEGRAAVDRTQGRLAFANDPLNLLVRRRPRQPGQRSTATRRRGFLRTSASAATTSPGRWRSSANTTRGSHRPSTTRSAHVLQPARPEAAADRRDPRSCRPRPAAPTLTPTRTATPAPSSDRTASGGGRVFAQLRRRSAPQDSPPLHARAPRTTTPTPNLDRDKDGLACES